MNNISIVVFAVVVVDVLQPLRENLMVRIYLDHRVKKTDSVYEKMLLFQLHLVGKTLPSACLYGRI